MRTLLFVSLFALAMPACGGANNDASADGADSLDGKADHGGASARYFELRPDLRRCASPTCGGYFVKRVNYATTTCADGVSRDECYVAAVDFGATKLTSDEQAAFAGKALIVRGTLVNHDYDAGTFANLAVTEVWASATEPSSNQYASFSGTVYRVVDRGVRCITWPCLTYRETKLNQTRSTDVAGVDLSPAGAGDDATNAAMSALTSDGVLVDGSNQTVQGPAGSAQQLVAAHFYTRALHADAPTEVACGGFVGGGCADGSWCDVTVANACNGADLPGVCKPVGQLCSQVYLPVCGCDGKTYANDCERLQAHVQRAYDGACN